MTRETPTFDINLQVVWDCDCFDEWYLTFNIPGFALSVCTRCFMHGAYPVNDNRQI